MPLLVHTVTASTRAELEIVVQREIAKGRRPVGVPHPNLFDGKTRDDRPAWKQDLERRR